MAYGYKRKRTYRRTYRRARPRYRATRARYRRTGGLFGRARPVNIRRPDRVSSRAAVRALKRTARELGVPDASSLLQPGKLRAVMNSVQDHATRFVNPVGVSLSEFRELASNPQFRAAARAFMNNDPWGVFQAAMGSIPSETNAIVPS